MNEISFSSEIQYNYQLKKYPFMKSAGNLSKYYNLDLRSLHIENDLNVLSDLYERGESFVVFGECTNLYLTARSYQGLFVEIEEYLINGMRFMEESKTFIVSADCFLKKFTLHAATLGYDFSVFYGIPGLIGAAVCGNSGSDGIEIGKFVKSIKVYNIEKRKYEVLDTQKDFFSARSSFISEHNKIRTQYIILECTLKADYLGKQECEKKMKIKRDARKFIDREACQTAGSFWVSSALPEEYRSKNKKVRDIIKEIGLNKVNYNGARYITDKCFLTTSETTKDSDVAALLDETIKKIENDYNFTPQKEVVILDYDGKISVDEFIKRYKQ